MARLRRVIRIEVVADHPELRDAASEIMALGQSLDDYALGELVETIGRAVDARAHSAATGDPTTTAERRRQLRLRPGVE